MLGERGPEHTALVGQLIGLDYGADPHIAAIASESRQLRDRAFHALASYFRALHERDRRPIVLLLDDLHWADEGSLDFVNHLVQNGAHVPLFLLCMTRATLYERRPLWGSGRSEHLRIDLAPLSKRGTRELIEALLRRLETVPAALRDLLASSAEGNPYFVEELIGMLIDDGVILVDREPWRVSADKLLDVRVPSTLAGVLQARIDSLPPAEKTALQQASVIGHVFWDEALQRIAPSAGEALDALMRRELAYGRETSAFEGTREFVFKHHVLHQVAYQGVLKHSRREQHRLTADWLVVRSGDRASEYFGLIAEHYERAGDIANALTYLRKAGEDAAASFVTGAALEYLGRALALAPEDDAATRFELLILRRTVYSNAGRRTEQGADIAMLEQLAAGLDDTARARAAALRASFALLVGEYPRAIAAAEQAVQLADAIGASAVALGARVNWARALQFQGDYAHAQVQTEESLGIARQIGDRRMETTDARPARHPGPAARRARAGARLLPRGDRRRAGDRPSHGRERDDQQPRRDRAAARQLRRGVRIVSCRPAAVRRARAAPARRVPALQHGDHPRSGAARRRRDRLGQASRSRPPRLLQDRDLQANCSSRARPRAARARAISTPRRSATAVARALSRDRPRRPCRPSRSPGWRAWRSRAASSRRRAPTRRDPRSPRRRRHDRRHRGSALVHLTCHQCPGRRRRCARAGVAAPGASTADGARGVARRAASARAFSATSPSHRAIVAAWDRLQPEQRRCVSGGASAPSPAAARARGARPSTTPVASAVPMKMTAQPSTIGERQPLAEEDAAPEHGEDRYQVGHGDRVRRPGIGDQAEVEDVGEAGAEDTRASRP